MEVDIVASKSLISLANIPVEDIFTYLTIVKGVSVRAENAADTDKVCGIDSDKIAMAAVNNEGDLIEDRNTVQNALNEVNATVVLSRVVSPLAVSA